MKSKPMQVLSRKLVSKHGSWVVTLTEADALSYKQKYNTNKVSCIHNPITIDLPEYTEPNAHKAVAVGRYTSQKGFDLLIKAWAKVEEKKDWKLVIAGKGKQTKLLQSLIEKYELTSSVELIPPTNNIQGLFKESGLYVMSSRFEGLPLVLIEAAAMGLPAVSFACQTGPEEIIEHEKTGLLVPPMNIDALASAIQTCILNDNLRIEFSKNAVSYVGEKFSTENIIDKWESLFNQLKQS
jgi:glycosyltransferase involved in cell wall biosynthesis